MSTNKIVAIVLVAIIHIAIGYALITGLAYNAVKKAIERVTTVDVSEPPPPPPDEPPPPPPDDVAPPPPMAPPPPISISVAPPPIQTVTTIPPPRPPAVIVPPPAPVAAPAPPPPPPPQRAKPVPRGRSSGWATNDDYPARALREEAQGTTRFTLTVGPDGRASDCQITGSSGNSSLDETTCRLMRQRSRFDPALDGNGQPTTGTWSNSVRWEIPD